MSKLINKTVLMKSCKSFLRYLSENLNALYYANVTIVKFKCFLSLKS